MGENYYKQRKFFTIIISFIMVFIISQNAVFADDFQNKPLNNDASVKATLSGNTLTISGYGDINKAKWTNLKTTLKPAFWDDTNSKIVLTADTGKKIYLPKNCDSFFLDYKGTIDLDETVDTSKVTDMQYMFARCPNANPDVSNFDTSNVTLMNKTFMGAKKACPDVSKWVTSNVESMGDVFNGCSTLTTLDVSKWDTSNVTNTSDMFNGCKNLTTLDVSEWDTSKVKNMANMFYLCNKLENLDVSKWDTSSVTSMSYMFKTCKSLENLDVSKWNTSNVKNMEALFSDCYKLRNIDVSKWDTSSVTNMSYMFKYCYKFTSLELSNFDTSKVSEMKEMFWGSKVDTLNIKNWDTSNVSSTYRMFKDSTINNLDISNWDTSNINDAREMFSSSTIRTKKIIMQNRAGTTNTKSSDFLKNGMPLDFLKFSGLNNFTWTSGKKYKVYVDGVLDNEYNAGHSFNFENNKEYRLFDPDIKKTVKFDIPSGCTVVVKKKDSTTPETQTATNEYKLNFGDYTYEITGASYNKPATAFEVSDDMTIVEKFTGNNIIPKKNTDGSTNTKPDGYITVKFTAERQDGLSSTVDISSSMTGQTTYFVNPYADKRLSDIFARVDKPKIADVKGFESVKWDRVPSTLLNLGNATAGEIVINGIQKHKKLGSGVYYKYDDPNNITKVSIFGEGSINRDKWNDMRTEYTGGLTNWKTGKAVNIEFIKKGTGKNIKFPYDSSKFFNNLRKGSVTFNEAVDTSQVRDMSGIFNWALQCQIDDISDWDISNVENLTVAFQYYKKNLDLSTWDTSRVKNMYKIFEGASSMNFDISSWNTARLERISEGFFGANNFKKIILINRGNKENTTADGMLKSTQADVIKFKGLKSFAWTTSETKKYLVKNITDNTINSFDGNTTITFDANDEYHIYASDLEATYTFSLTPSDATLTVKDTQTPANTIAPQTDGTYKLNIGKTYTYEASKTDYQTETESFTADEIEKNVSVVLTEKQAITLATTPTLTATYGQSLSDLTVADLGNDDYDVTWKTPSDKVGDVSSSPNTHTAIYTPKGTYANTYKTTEIGVNVTVNKADFPYAVPELAAVYDTLLKDVVNNSSDNDKYTIEWIEDKNTTKVGNFGENNHSANLVPNDGNYKTLSNQQIKIDVTKKTIGDISEKITAKYGQTLNDIANSPVLTNSFGNWTFDDNKSTPVGAIGDNTFNVTFTATNTNYADKNSTVTVKVIKADAPNLVAIDQKEKVSVDINRTIDLSTKINMSNAGTVSYSTALSSKDFLTSISISGNYLTYQGKSDNVGDSVIIPITVSSDNFENATVNIRITIEAKDKSNPKITSVPNVTYGNTLDPNTITKSDDAGGGEWTFNPLLTDDSLKGVGNHSVNATFTPTNNNFAVESVDFTFTVVKANMTIRGITTVDREYNGTSNVEINYSNPTFDGVKYSDSPSITSVTAIVGNANVEDDKPVTLTVILDDDTKSKYNISTENLTVNISKASLPVSGDIEITTKYAVDKKYSEVQLPSSNMYDIVWADENAKIGTVGTHDVSVTLSPKGTYSSNYKDTAKDIKLIVEKGKLPQANTIYSGKYKQKLSDIALTNGSNYTLTWKDEQKQLTKTGENESCVITLTPNDTANFESYDYTVNVRVDKADAISNLSEYTEKVRNGDTSEKSFDLSTLMLSDAEFESASIGTILANTVLNANPTLMSDNRTLKYSINLASTVGDSVRIPVTITSKNYQNSSTNLVIEVIEKLPDNSGGDSSGGSTYYPYPDYDDTSSDDENTDVEVVDENNENSEQDSDEENTDSENSDNADKDRVDKDEADKENADKDLVEKTSSDDEVDKNERPDNTDVIDNESKVKAAFVEDVTVEADKNGFLIANEESVVDTPANMWFSPSVKYVIEKEYIPVNEEKGFMPYDKVSRSMAIQVIYNIAKANDGVKKYDMPTLFDDINKNNSNNAIRWAYNEGVANGVSKTMFMPNSSLSREDFIVFLYRYHTKNMETVEKYENHLNDYIDRSDVGLYAKEALNWAIDSGLIKGVGGNVLSPKKGITKAQMACVIKRYEEMKMLSVLSKN